MRPVLLIYERVSKQNEIKSSAPGPAPPVVAPPKIAPPVVAPHNPNFSVINQNILDLKIIENERSFFDDKVIMPNNMIDTAIFSFEIQNNPKSFLSFTESKFFGETDILVILNNSDDGTIIQCKKKIPNIVKTDYIILAEVNIKDVNYATKNLKCYNVTSKGDFLILNYTNPTNFVLIQLPILNNQPIEKKWISLKCNILTINDEIEKIHFPNLETPMFLVNNSDTHNQKIIIANININTKEIVKKNPEFKLELIKLPKVTMITSFESNAFVCFKDYTILKYDIKTCTLENAIKFNNNKTHFYNLIEKILPYDTYITNNKCDFIALFLKETVNNEEHIELYNYNDENIKCALVSHDIDLNKNKKKREPIHQAFSGDSKKLIVCYDTCIVIYILLEGNENNLKNYYTIYEHERIDNETFISMTPNYDGTVILFCTKDKMFELKLTINDSKPKNLINTEILARLMNYKNIVDCEKISNINDQYIVALENKKITVKHDCVVQINTSTYTHIYLESTNKSNGVYFKSCFDKNDNFLICITNNMQIVVFFLLADKKKVVEQNYALINFFPTIVSINTNSTYFAFCCNDGRNYYLFIYKIDVQNQSLTEITGYIFRSEIIDITFAIDDPHIFIIKYNSNDIALYNILEIETIIQNKTGMYQPKNFFTPFKILKIMMAKNILSYIYIDSNDINLVTVNTHMTDNSNKTTIVLGQLLEGYYYKLLIDDTMQFFMFKNLENENFLCNINKENNKINFLQKYDFKKDNYLISNAYFSHDCKKFFYKTYENSWKSFLICT